MTLPERNDRPTDERAAQAQEIIRRGFESLAQELNEGHTDRYIAYLDFLARFHRYSAANQMLIFMQKPDATLVAGYRHWQELGHQVKRGEHGLTIFAPVRVKVTEQTAAGEEQEVQKLVGFKPVKVFDSSQLVEPPQEFWSRLADDAQAEYALIAEAVAAGNIEIREAPMPRDRQGESKGGLILIRQGLDSRSRTHVLIHEWAHEILHRQWMDFAESRQIPVAVRELQVESVSYIVSRYLGLDNPFSRDYLLHYGNTIEALMENMEQIQRATKFMIEQIEMVAGKKRPES